MEDHCCSEVWPAMPSHPNWVQSSTDGAVSDESFRLQLTHHHISSSASTHQVNNGFPSWSTTPNQEAAEDRAASVSKSHRQAEKRRRDRINAQLGILRKLIPRSDKMDKAALLGSVIDQVKELKREATEISRGGAFIVPTEVDEVTVESDVHEDQINPTNNIKDKDNILIRASVCCEDRPELFSELIRVLKGLRLSIVRADIGSVGGRVKSILVLSNNSKESKEDGGGISLSTVKQSLNVVLSRIASTSLPSNYRIRSKRQRFFLPSY